MLLGIFPSLLRLPRVLFVEMLTTAVACLWLGMAFQAGTPSCAAAAVARVELTQAEQAFLQRHPVITLGTDKNWAPYVVVGPDGRLGGYDYDILSRINAATGAHFRLKIGKWSRMLEMARSRRIDGLSSGAAVAERKAYLNFSHPYVTTQKRVLVLRGNPKRIEQAEDLEGKVIVVQEGNVMSARRARAFKPARVLKVKGAREIVDALLAGSADATLDDGTFFYVAQKFGMPFLRVAFSLGEELPLVFAVRNDWPEAVAILNKGLAAIPDEEKNSLKEKWFSVEEEGRYIGQVLFLLNEAEKKYLAGRSSISMCVDPNWMPYEELDGAGQHVGLVADFMALVSGRIGKRFSLVKTRNWTQSLLYAREHKCDILSGAVPTPQRRTYLAFSQPYITFPLVVATGLDKVYIEDFSRVADKKVAVIKDYAAIDFLRKRYPNLSILEVDDAFVGLKMVREKKVFGYIDTVASIGYQIQRHGMLDVKISGQLDLDYDLAVGVRKDRPELVSIVNKAIASISSEERKTIMNHWLSVRYEKGFDYSLFWKLALGIGVLLAFILYRYLIMSRYNKRLLEMNAQLDLLYRTDRLTEIFNRHALDVELEKEISRARRYGTPFSVIMLDLDNFKAINDTYGHHAGDTVLRKIADVLGAQCRSVDIVGRWGGEEFLVLCPHTASEGAAHLAESLRRQIADLDFSMVQEEVTASFGVAPYRAGDESETIIKRADAALYDAKRRSRNCVVVAGADE